ncbi:hypothetical protein ERO13_D01G083100v2 [Gossypium hirsutum]|uniref:UPF0481 protein At3g47200 isoform X2 n=1 Tax=Gossypium hirsutum TaxID=3635 RepID=A0A1U8L257_GOSHI|nr:UPF0481 protein At3g47200 isoform X2 [Gossypium hirsutum]KAG4161873.1 hypothetical protein ERO13_D01G083100v2 [Gossypium hirsutum]
MMDITIKKKLRSATFNVKKSLQRSMMDITIKEKGGLPGDVDNSYKEPDAKIQATAENPKKRRRLTTWIGSEGSVEANWDTNPKLESKEKDVTDDDGDLCYSTSSSVSPCIFKTPFPGLQFQEPQLASNWDTNPKLESKEKDVTDDDGDLCYSTSSSVSPCIFKTPFPGLQFQEPQLASIGPYHYTNRNLPLDKYKYSFLDRFISRTGKDLRFYVQQMMSLERHSRTCYSHNFSMSSPQFVEMMLLDGCFIMEVLHHFGVSEQQPWVFPIEPWQLPILVQDLLILDNQIPFFVLEMLFESLESQEGTPTPSLCTKALKFFDLAFPLSMDIACPLKPHHLLDLLLQSIRSSSPSQMVAPNFVYSFLKKISTRNQADTMRDQLELQPPFYLTKNAMELQASGIELRSTTAARFTNINFNNGGLEIPSVTINDIFIAILNNFVAFEHCSETSSKDFTAYVSFMSKLIRHPSDAELLCSNGIISRFSHNEQKVVQSFHMLWMNILDLDVQHSYLSKRLKELEWYYTQDGKTRPWRRLVSRYWRICFFCITNLVLGFNRLRSGVNLMIHFVEQVKFNGINGEFQGDITCPQDHTSFICDSVFRMAGFIYKSARGRVKSIDLSLRNSKFMAFFFLNLVIVIIILMGHEIPPPPAPSPRQLDEKVDYSRELEEEADEFLRKFKKITLEAKDQYIKVEDPVAADKEGIEVEDSTKRKEKSGGDTSRVSWSIVDKNEMIVDCVSNEEYYNEAWSKILEHKVIGKLLSALSPVPWD